MKTYPRIAFEIILPATKGEPKALHDILNHYEGYIAKLSLRPMTDEFGNQRMVVDEELRGRLHKRLIEKIFSFDIH